MRPEVGLVAGGEDEAGFLAEELGQGVLELLVQVERAVQEAAAGAARAVRWSACWAASRTFGWWVRPR